MVVYGTPDSRANSALFIFFSFINKSNLSVNKLGIAVSKKNGKANLRNKIKRLIRENYKNYETKIKNGTNLLITVNKDVDIKKVSFYDIKNDFDKILKKAEIG